MQLSYEKQTVASANPLARYAHRNRIRKSIDLILQKYTKGLILDYGCGSGAIVTELLSLYPNCAIGYEPFMQERTKDNLPIFNDLDKVRAQKPFELVSLFETVEHLSDSELSSFLELSQEVLTTTGGILVSGPIEIGPALLAKEFNRSLFRFRAPEHNLIELIKASVFGMRAQRALDIKTSHKGFDFRLAIAAFRRHGWNVEILHFGPLPIQTWYGNSQFYLWLTRSESCKT